MAYSPLPTKVAGDTITLTNYNNLRDNFIAGVPDVFTTKGDLAVATAADTASRLGVGNDDDTLVADVSQATGLAWQIQPAARVYNSGSQTPPATTWTALTFDSERFDTNGMHSLLANTSRLTVPSNGDGLYWIGANVEWPFSGAGAGVALYGIRLLLNGATVIAQKFIYISSGSLDIATDIQTFYSFVATDYVEVQVYHAGSIAVSASSNYSPEFFAVWQRRP